MKSASKVQTRADTLPKKGRMRNRGRALNYQAQDEVKALLDGKVRDKSLLIEYLHLIQDEFGGLSHDHLHALGLELKLSMAAVYEVASFYHHFDILKDGEGPAKLTVRVCDSLSCAMVGADEIINAVQAQIGKKISDDVKIVHAPCMGMCDHAPAAMVGKNAVGHISDESLINLIQNQDDKAMIPEFQNLSDYMNEGGFSLLTKLKTGKITGDEIIQALNQSGLRGLGGAGFPTGRKWGLVREQQGEKLMAVNGDEGEPGTFKDRHYLQTKPFQFLEGTLIAAHIVGAKTVYIYLRDEYPAAYEILKSCIKALQDNGMSDHSDIDLRRGAGAYICGEESAMIESIEGKRGLPRHRPPYVAQKGLFNKPTLVNNIETLYWVAPIVNDGPEVFASKGRHGAKGLRSYSVSGRVKSPGVKLAPAGITLNELIHEYCDGMADGHDLKAYLPGGASGGILPANLADEPLDFGRLEQYGSFVGSHAVIVLSQHDDLKKAVKNLTAFFADESCGQCTPCRAGCDKSLQLMKTEEWDKQTLSDIGDWMSDSSICGLGQAAANPMKSLFRFFDKELGS